MAGGKQLVVEGLEDQGFQLPNEVVLRPFQRVGRRISPNSPDYLAAEAQIFDYLFEPQGGRAIVLRRASSPAEVRRIVQQIIENADLLEPARHPSCIEFVPIEWIRLLAHRNYEARGCQHGHHEADWFAAKVYLFEQLFPLMTSPEWDVSLRDTVLNLSLDEALSFVAQFDRDQGKMLRPQIQRPPRKEPKKVPTIKTVKRQDPELVRMAEANPDALSLLSDTDRKLHAGKLVAVLVDPSADRGRVFASVDLTAKDADAQLLKRVNESPFRRRRWAQCEILADAKSTDASSAT
jgi:hypothetical protein